MAVEHVTAVLHGLLGVDPSEKLVMLILAEHARRGDARAWPSLDTIARLACLGRRQVHAILVRLVDAGWLILERRGGGRAQDGSGFPNVYRLNMERLLKARHNSEAERTVKGEVERKVKGAAWCHVKEEARVHVKGEVERTVDANLSTGPPATMQPTAPLTVQSSADNGAVEGGEGCSPASKNGAAGCTQTGFEPLLKATGTTTGSIRTHAREASGPFQAIGQVVNRLRKYSEPEGQQQPHEPVADEGAMTQEAADYGMTPRSDETKSEFQLRIIEERQRRCSAQSTGPPSR